MARPTDQEVTADEKTVCYSHTSQRRGHFHCTRRRWGQLGGREREGKLWARAFIATFTGRNA